MLAVRRMRAAGPRMRSAGCGPLGKGAGRGVRYAGPRARAEGCDTLGQGRGPRGAIRWAKGAGLLEERKKWRRPEGRRHSSGPGGGSRLPLTLRVRWREPTLNVTKCTCLAPVRARAKPEFSANDRPMPKEFSDVREWMKLDEQREEEAGEPNGEGLPMTPRSFRGRDPVPPDAPTRQVQAVAPGAGFGSSSLGLGSPGTGTSSQSARSKHVPLWAWPALGLGLVAVALVVIGILSWPRVSLSPSRTALASLKNSGATGKVTVAKVSFASNTVGLKVEKGRLYPVSDLPTGEKVRVEVTEQVPGWIAWLAGHHKSASLLVLTPKARLLDSVSVVKPGEQPVATFSMPVSRIAWLSGHHGAKEILPRPTAEVHIGPKVASTRAGSLIVKAAPMSWEKLSGPQDLSYFALTGNLPGAVVTPGPGSVLSSPTGPVAMTFSEPIVNALGPGNFHVASSSSLKVSSSNAGSSKGSSSRSSTKGGSTGNLAGDSSATGVSLPTVKVEVSGQQVTGRWVSNGPYSLVFYPNPGQLWPGQTLEVSLPRKLAVGGSSGKLSAMSTFTISTPPASTLRLQELLAKLHYLPLRWTPAPGAPKATTMAEEQALAYDPPRGSFSWRWSMPARLEDLWSEGHYTVMTKGALMAFEHVEGLNFTNPRSNPLLWPYLAKAALQDKLDPHPYVWIDVTKTLPEHMNLWSNGKIVITSLVNTGIPQSPTQDGTFPVYLRYRANWMNGFNPNGTPYHDWVKWISYFNGGDAVHGFYRPLGYGFPQSLGCVELPVEGTDPIAEQVWGYDHIGTLVTVHQ